MHRSASIGLFALVSSAFLTHAATAPAANYQIERKDVTYRIVEGNIGEQTIHERLKALNAEGREAIGRIEIPYMPAFDEVEFRYIKTLKKDGTVVEGDVSAAFDQSASGDPYFSDEKYRTVLAPNVDTGDSVEYQVTTRTKQWPTPGDFFFSHNLWTAVPVASETVVLDLPSDHAVAFWESGEPAGEVEIANGRRIERWTVSNLEPAPRRAGKPLFAVTSVRSWDAVGEWIRSLNDKATQPAPELMALAQKLIAGKKTPAERIAALYTYVATKVRYVSVSFGAGHFQPHSALSVFHNGYGDCKDQTALLTTLLRAAGFQAYPVLASPGEDLVWEVPLPVQFIHEFTAVETGMGLMFLDTAVGPAQPQTLLPGVRGRSALLVGASGASRIEIPLETPVPTSIAEDLKGTVNAGGGFEGSVQLEFGGLMEALLRRLFLDGADADKEKALLGLMGAEFRGATVSRIESGDATDLSRPFQVRFGLSKKDFFAPGEGSLKVTLGWSGWAFQGPDESAKPDRPVPLDAIALSTKMDLAIDTSFTITEGLPLHRKTRLCDYDSEFSYEDGRLLLRRTFSLRAAMLQPSDWEEIHTTLREARDESKGGFTLSRK